MEQRHATRFECHPETPLGCLRRRAARNRRPAGDDRCGRPHRRAGRLGAPGASPGPGCRIRVWWRCWSRKPRRGCRSRRRTGDPCPAVRKRPARSGRPAAGVGRRLPGAQSATARTHRLGATLSGDGRRDGPVRSGAVRLRHPDMPATCLRAMRFGSRPLSPGSPRRGPWIPRPVWIPQPNSRCWPPHRASPPWPWRGSAPSWP